MFRLANNAPEVYVTKSRDFQLLCNLFDLVNNGVKFDIDTIMTQSDTELCRDNLLPLLQHKLGFFTDVSIDDESLRTILKVFPSIVKKKGTKEGIAEAIQLFFYTQKVNGATSVVINNVGTNLSGDYIIKCSLTSKLIYNIDILHEILKYVVPTGYFIEYAIYRDADLANLPILVDGSTIRIIQIQDDDQSKIGYLPADSDDAFTSNMAVVPIDET